LIKGALVAHPAVRSVTDDTAPNIWRVVAETASRQWTLRVVADPNAGLPSIRVLNEEVIGALAHVNYEGTVCFTDNEGLSVDTTRAAAVVAYALSNALNELERSAKRQAAGDNAALADEVEGYWFSLPRARPVDAHVTLDTRVREITAFTTAGRECVAFAERHQLRQTPYAGLQRLSGLPERRAIYLPLSRPLRLPTLRAPLTSAHAREWILDALDGPTRARFELLLKSWPRRVSEAYILLSQSRSDGSVAAVGLQYVGKGSRHPLLDPAGKWELRPLVVRRHTPPYLRARGGGLDALADRHIAIVGCGAVGARVAEHLALAGVRTLTLIDPDRFDADNIYRHVLGGDAVGILKVSALKLHLERRLPAIRIDAVESDLRSWTTPTNIAGVDGIVVAVGRPHVERQFVGEVRGWSELRGPIVTTWLEPFGLGGHAQRTMPGQAGCLECLYTERDGGTLLAPRVAFAEPNQALSRNMTGCAGSFTPYSALDATQTALLAVRMLTDALSSAGSPSLSSWKGVADAFAAAGFATTPWYRSWDESHLKMSAVEYSRVPCPICGGTK
jgi:hypothetical protein